MNAHSLNLAYENPQYREVLAGARFVLGDGAGVRLAAKWRGVRLKANLVGTDLIPNLFSATAGRGYRYFLLGADERTNRLAAEYAQRSFPGWTLVGSHHGYLAGPTGTAAIEMINASKPHLLLVGMGNPRQEEWIARTRDLLEVPLSIGVGGLFDHWGGNLVRAPKWMRDLGIEWIQILWQQPARKWERYLVGNPKFVWRTDRAAAKERGCSTFRVPGAAS